MHMAPGQQGPGTTPGSCVRACVHARTRGAQGCTINRLSAPSQAPALGAAPDTSQITGAPPAIGATAT